MEALATKYRPTNFTDVIGQDNVITILKNQLKLKSTKQGYLFCGSAGTGKTTAARIMAKELKAELVEIDAASNNGVDGIRELRDNIKFKPMANELRVYIIDEVHQLSTGAFNALLKTLEEPPAHVVFILCTTDPQKIPATIISRVQRFDFHRVPTSIVSARLKYIIQCENDEACEQGCDSPYVIGDGVFEYIAKLTAGGVRDAISTLDTCLGYGDSLTLEAVTKILGTVNYSVYFNLIKALQNNEQDEIPKIIEDIFNQGKDLKLFVSSFIDFVCDLEKYYFTKSLDLLNIPDSFTKDLEDIKYDKIDLNALFKKLIGLSKFIKYEARPKNVIIGWLFT